MEHLSFEVDESGIATITWDIKNRPMNVFSEETIAEFMQAVDKIASDPAVRGAVITSARPEFITGADIKMIEARAARNLTLPRDQVVKETFDSIYAFQKVFRTLETCGKPVACAVAGTALGGGFELMLATQHRVVVDDDKISLGLPESTIGIMPGWGGTQRAPRLGGVMATAQLLMEGRPIKPRKALQLGLVSELCLPGREVETAKTWVANNLEEGDKLREKRAAGDKRATAGFLQPWDRPKFKVPGGDPYSPSGFPVFSGASAMLRKTSYGLYDAQKAILSAVYEGLQVDMDNALKIETRYSVKLHTGPQALNMSRTFFLNKGALEKGARRPDTVQKAPVQKLGVLGGGGFMGAGIANVSAQAGIQVIVLDQTEEGAAKAKAHAEKDLMKKVSRGRMTEEKAKEILSRISTSADYAALEGCDLIVEAVFEDPGVKKIVTESAEAKLPETAIFATNTSTIPISDLAKNSVRPEQYIGIHFFSPVEKMPLVEIIKGEKTGDAAIAKAYDYVRQLRKTPILVNDARYFYANRVVLRYIEEAHFMLVEGVKPVMIENAAKMVGMPVGPLALNDETALDLGVKIRNATKAALGDAYVPGPTDEQIEKMVLEMGRLGRKSGSGFYDYPENGKKKLWPGLAELFPVAETQPDIEDLKKRFLTAQALEAVWAIQENVVTDVREADVGSIMGWGFAPWSGGPISYIDTLGVKKFLAECEELSAKFEGRYKIPQILRDIAEKGGTFYGHFMQQAA